MVLWKNLNETGSFDSLSVYNTIECVNESVNFAQGREGERCSSKVLWGKEGGAISLFDKNTASL